MNPAPTPEAAPSSAPHTVRSRTRTFRTIYPLRVLGMGLGCLVVISVLVQNNELSRWSWLCLGLLVWPHLAYLHARFSADPYRAEACNLLVDSAIAGLWIPIMHFNLLPSVVLSAVTTQDKLSSGIRGLWLWSLPVWAGTALLATAWLRPTPVWESSMPVVVCTLLVIVLHSMAVGITGYRLLRTVARQNLQLQELRRRDTQTGLSARAHWQEQAQGALLLAHASGQPAWLLMIDIDHFKGINDMHGHTVGDAAIRLVGASIQECVRHRDCAGRFGGDEFVVVCANTEAAPAHAIAERIRARVEQLRLPQWPGLRLSASIGMAELDRHATLDDWLNAADEALYRAKRGGRNQVATHAEAAAPGDSAAQSGTAAP